MDLKQRLSRLFSRRRPPVIPAVTPRVSVDGDADGLSRYVNGLSAVSALFPFELYGIMEQLFLTEPYFERYHHDTLALGNTGHALTITGGTEAQQAAAVEIANEFAASCFPWAGGLDGCVNAIFSQICRFGGFCIEIAPEYDGGNNDVHIVPIKSIRFTRDVDGELVLNQQQGSRLVPLDGRQTFFCAVSVRDSNPYPVPPAITALQTLVKLGRFNESLDGWLRKFSGFGLVTALLEPPQMDYASNESNEAYQVRAAKYLKDFAESVGSNLKGGLAASYNNVEFAYHNIANGAAGANDIHNTLLQSLFAALQRDPVFFGHNFNTTETFAKVVFEAMIQGILTYQLSVKRALEFAHKVNLAAYGLAHLDVSVEFNPNRSADAFMDGAALQMETAAVVSQLEAGVIDLEEARAALGHKPQPQASTNGPERLSASFIRSSGYYVAHVPKAGISGLQCVWPRDSRAIAELISEPSVSPAAVTQENTDEHRTDFPN